MIQTREITPQQAKTLLMMAPVHDTMYGCVDLTSLVQNAFNAGHPDPVPLKNVKDTLLGREAVNDFLLNTLGLTLGDIERKNLLVFNDRPTMETLDEGGQARILPELLVSIRALAEIAGMSPPDVRGSIARELLDAGKPSLENPQCIELSPEAIRKLGYTPEQLEMSTFGRSHVNNGTDNRHIADGKGVALLSKRELETQAGPYTKRMAARQPTATNITTR